MSIIFRKNLSKSFEESLLLLLSFYTCGHSVICILSVPLLASTPSDQNKCYNTSIHLNPDLTLNSEN